MILGLGMAGVYRWAILIAFTLILTLGMSPEGSSDGVAGHVAAADPSELKPRLRINVKAIKIAQRYTPAMPKPKIILRLAKTR